MFLRHLLTVILYTKTQKVSWWVLLFGDARNIHKSFFIKSHYWNLKLVVFIIINTLFEIGKNLHSSSKNLQSNLHQVKKNKNTTATTNKQTTTATTTKNKKK